MRDAFGDTAGLKSKWSFLGVTAFLVWGIPMSVTVAGMFAKAWQREQFGLGQRLARGVIWFALYLAMIALRERIAYGTDHQGAVQIALFVVALVPVWIFWSLTPVLLVRDGGHEPVISRGPAWPGWSTGSSSRWRDGSSSRQ